MEKSYRSSLDFFNLTKLYLKANSKKARKDGRSKDLMLIGRMK